MLIHTISLNLNKMHSRSDAMFQPFLLFIKKTAVYTACQYIQNSGEALVTNTGSTDKINKTRNRNCTKSWFLHK